MQGERENHSKGAMMQEHGNCLLRFLNGAIDTHTYISSRQKHTPMLTFEL